MSKKVNKQEATLKSAFLTAAGVFAVAAGESFRTSELLMATVFLTLAAVSYGVHEVLSQKQFAFEDEFADFIADLGGAEELSEETAQVIEENEDEIREVVEDVADGNG